MLQGAAFTSFKLSLLTLASTQRDFDFLIYFSLLPFACLYANFSALENGSEYSFTLILSIVISCIPADTYWNARQIYEYTQDADAACTISGAINEIYISIKDIVE